jgi:hypothetical protein
MVLPDEDPHEFDRYRIPMMRGLEPRDGLEQELAEQIVSLGWKLRRLRRVEGDHPPAHAGQRRCAAG